MDLPAIVTRLKAEVTALRKVGLAGDLAAVLEGKLPDATGPSAFVLIAEELGGQAKLSVGSYIQPVTERLAVVLTFREISNRSGDRLVDEVETVKKAVREALLGWIPPGANGALALAHGATVLLKPGLYAWGYQFNASTQLRIAR